MKKSIAMLGIASLLLTATTVFAAEGKVGASAKLGDVFKLHLGQDKFVINGSVNAVGSTSLTVNILAGSHVKGIEGAATVAVNADTKVVANDGEIKAGERVMIKGEITDSGLVAKSIHSIGSKAEVHAKAKANVAAGAVTAKTDTSVTIKNAVTGVEKTLTVNPDTEVSLNGEASTFADVQVGDRGMVKFKAVLDTFVATMIRLFR